jgi:hypothetical protein
MKALWGSAKEIFVCIWSVWDTVTGNPLRVLHSSVSPILRVYTSCVVNKVVTLLADNSFQVWNLDNIDSNANLPFGERITCLTLSSVLWLCWRMSVTCPFLKLSTFASGTRPSNATILPLAVDTSVPNTLPGNMLLEWSMFESMLSKFRHSSTQSQYRWQS